MAESKPTSCSGCRRLQEQLDAQRRQLESLQATVTQLEQQLAAARKNSSTSSKPPSSDVVKAVTPSATPDEEGKRSPGGQPGHPKHERAAFPPEAINGGIHAHVLDCCPDCGQGLQSTDLAPRVVQQIDVREVPLIIEEHRGHPAWCPRCQKVHYAPLPSGIEHGGLVGPRLTAFIAYLKGGCHSSYSTIRKFLRDVMGVTISRGQLAKIISKVSDALEPSYQELLEDLVNQPHLNVDETGHKDQGERMWTWCFRAELYVLFKVAPSRGADVLIDVLGTEFNGVLGCDFFGAYRRFHREFDVVLQFCLAHLIREVKYLTTLPDLRDQVYGERLLDKLRKLFSVFNRAEYLETDEFWEQLEAARDEVLLWGIKAAPATRHGENLAKRLEKYGKSYFEFMTTAGVEPTNNLAEQAIRFVVIDRLITQGTRGETGQRWCERIWTVMATCGQRGRSVYEYLQEAVAAHFEGKQGPTLMPGRN